MRDRIGKSLRPSLRLEEWAQRDSVLHRRDARGKALSVLIFLIAAATIPPTSPIAFLPVLAVLGGAILLSGLPVAEILLRASLILPFPIFFALVGWLEHGRLPVAVALVARSYVSAVAVVLLMGVTPLPELLRALRGLGVPAVLVMVLQSLVRYLQVILDHAMRMRRAALCRDAGRPLGQRRSLWRRASGALAVLFGRSYARAEGVHRAMLARGFQGEFISPRPARFTAADWTFLSVTLLVVVGARLLSQVWL